MLHVALLVFRAPSGPAAREIATREPDGSEWSISKPARALRTLRRPLRRRRLRCWGVAWSVVSKPALSLRTLRRPLRRRRLRCWGVAWCVVSKPGQARHRPRAPQLGQRGYCASSTFACNSSVTISVFELVSLELQRFWVLLKVHAIELHAESLVCVSVVTYGHRSRSLLEARPVSPDPPAPSTPAALALLGCRLVRRLEARPGPPPPTSAAAWSTRLLCV